MGQKVNPAGYNLDIVYDWREHYASDMSSKKIVPPKIEEIPNPSAYPFQKRKTLPPKKIIPGKCR